MMAHPTYICNIYFIRIGLSLVLRLLEGSVTQVIRDADRSQTCPWTTFSVSELLIPAAVNRFVYDRDFPMSLQTRDRATGDCIPADIQSEGQPAFQSIEERKGFIYGDFKASRVSVNFCSKYAALQQFW